MKEITIDLYNYGKSLLVRIPKDQVEKLLGYKYAKCDYSVPYLYIDSSLFSTQCAHILEAGENKVFNGTNEGKECRFYVKRIDFFYTIIPI